MYINISTATYRRQICLHNVTEALQEPIELLLDGLFQQVLHVQVNVLLLVVVGDWNISTVEQEVVHDVLAKEIVNDLECQIKVFYVSIVLV